MAQASKHRDCPAVGRVIKSAECGENRNSRYTCPAHCAFNPFAPDQYLQALEITDRVDAEAERWLANTMRAGNHGQNEFFRLEGLAQGYPRSMGMFRLMMASGPSGSPPWAQRFIDAGAPGLRNDDLVLLKARMQSQLGLLEVRRIFDDRRVEFVDLLRPGIGPFVVYDLSVAAEAVRYMTFPAFYYPLPHYWRVLMPLPPLPDLLESEGADGFHELIQHLGGPAALDELSSWAIAHVDRLDAALRNTMTSWCLAQLKSLDIVIGKARYALRQPNEVCRGRLEQESALVPDHLTDSETDDGCAGAWVWKAPANEPVPVEGVCLGRVVLGPDEFRLNTFGSESLPRLRAAFEGLMGDSVVLIDETSISPPRPELPSFDASLVPPRLMEDSRRPSILQSRLPLLDADQTERERPTSLQDHADRRWLNTRVPALGDKTPLEAAHDPALRPVLLRMLKFRIRQTDQDNLDSGTRRDLDEMLRELGAEELILDPPPVRPPRSSEEVPDDFEDPFET